ncbi:MAG: hypothetical protein ACRC5R_06005 [Mycoplasmatales bacterium]
MDEKAKEWEAVVDPSIASEDVASTDIGSASNESGSGSEGGGYIPEYEYVVPAPTPEQSDQLHQYQCVKWKLSKLYLLQC